MTSEQRGRKSNLNVIGPPVPFHVFYDNSLNHRPTCVPTTHLPLPTYLEDPTQSSAQQRSPLPRKALRPQRIKAPNELGHTGATIVTAATTKTRKITESKLCHLVKRQWPASSNTQSWARPSSPKARHGEEEAQGDPAVVTEPPDSDSIRQGANIGDLTGLRATRETKTPPVPRLSPPRVRRLNLKYP